MIKNYSHNGKDFQTVTIPKGTALFRGMDYDETKPDQIFYDLIGYNNCIAPTNNIFFYPAPYVSECIKLFKIHAMYITNYDIELLLLIKPSMLHRGLKYEYTPQDILTKCNNIASKDKCGGLLNDIDICLTFEGIHRFPQIAGYIAIADADKTQFHLQHTRLMEHGKKKQMLQIMPTIACNSRGFISVPEIVIHPLHFRRLESVNIRERFRNPEDIVTYSLQNKAQYNFFPLLYIYKGGTFTFKDLKSINTLKVLQKTEPDEGPIKNKTLKILKNIMNKLLSPYGYVINNINYKLNIDMRTGYYMFASDNSNTQEERKTGKIIITDNINRYHTRYSYPEKNKHQLMKIASVGYDLTENEFEKYLNLKGMSITPEYIFEKGGNKYRKMYHINEVLSNTPIIPASRNKTRKNKEEKRLKDIYNMLDNYE